MINNTAVKYQFLYCSHAFYQNSILMFCSSFFISGKLSKCEKALLEATANKGLIGSYIPQCTESGDYEAMQCHASTGYCWCVDENGEEIKGTKSGRGDGSPNCGGKYLLYVWMRMGRR